MARRTAAAPAASPEVLVRRAATGLADAIRAARAAGYVVETAFPEAALGRIAISATAAVGATPSPLPGQPAAVIPDLPPSVTAGGADPRT